MKVIADNPRQAMEKVFEKFPIRSVVTITGISVVPALIQGNSSLYQVEFDLALIDGPEEACLIVSGQIKIRGDDGKPTGELGPVEKFIAYGNGYYPVSQLTGAPGVLPYQVKLEGDTDGV